MFAATKEMGTYIGFPDVCITPVPPPVSQAPIPYPNAALCPVVEDTAEKVYISGSKAVIKKSKFSSSNGDQPGAKGGVASSKTMGKVEHILGSLMVKIEGSNAMRMTSTATQNEKNIVGAMLVPSQAKLLILV